MLDNVEEKLNEYSAMIKAEIDYYLELDHDLRNGYEDGDETLGIGVEKLFL